MFLAPLDSMQVVSFEDQASYLSEASQPLRDIAKVMLGTGMRPEEVLRIRAENVGFKQKTIFNPFGKTKAARRTIPMTVDVHSLLKARTHKAENKATPFVSASPYDTHRPIGSVKNAHQTAMTRAKIKRHFRLYDLRRTFATRAVASGMDLPTLSALLGHASIQMTMRYVHPAAAQKRVAIREFDKFSTNEIIAAAAARQNQRVPTEVTTVEQIN
jgi:integrase